MIRKVLMSTVAVMAISGTAFAADLPSRRAPPVYIPPPIPVFSWTGFYIGGQVGYAFGRDNENLRLSPRGAALAGGFRNASVGFGNSPNGIIGGAHAGYNFSTQSFGPLLGGGGAGLFGGGLVLGVEGDIDGTDYRGASVFTVGNVAGARFTNRVEIEGSARGRVGIAVDRALFYATGGAAFAQFQHGDSIILGPAAFNEVFSHTRIGWTVGGGIEYAITTQWSLRAEYRYSDFGSVYQPIFAGLVDSRHKLTQERAQVGFSYKFDTPVAPVVARY